MVLQLIMAYVVMACEAITRGSLAAVKAYEAMAYGGMAYIVMVYVVMAYVVMAYVVMAYVVMAYVVMAYVVMACKAIMRSAAVWHLSKHMKSWSI